MDQEETKGFSLTVYCTYCQITMQQNDEIYNCLSSQHSYHQQCIWLLQESEKKLDFTSCHPGSRKHQKITVKCMDCNYNVDIYPRHDGSVVSGFIDHVNQIKETRVQKSLKFIKHKINKLRKCQKCHDLLKIPQNQMKPAFCKCQRRFCPVGLEEILPEDTFNYKDHTNCVDLSQKLQTKDYYIYPKDLFDKEEAKQKPQRYSYDYFSAPTQVYLQWSSKYNQKPQREDSEEQIQKAKEKEQYVVCGCNELNCHLCKLSWNNLHDLVGFLSFTQRFIVIYQQLNQDGSKQNYFAVGNQRDRPNTGQKTNLNKGQGNPRGDYNQQSKLSVQLFSN